MLWMDTLIRELTTLNVNVFGKEKLIDAMEHPEKKNMQTLRSVYLDMQLSSST